MKFSTYINSFRSIVPVLLFFGIGVFHSLEAQTVQGPTNVEQDVQETYSLSFPSSGVFWQAPASVTLTNPNDSGVTAVFNSPGTFYIRASFQSGGSSTLNVTVTGTPKPNDPVVESILCGSAKLKGSGGIPTGVTWYWQGKNINGESTANPIDRTKSFTHPDNLYTANQGTGYYYLRARDNSNLKWSYAKGLVYVTIPDTPSAPAVPTQQPVCGTSNIKLTLPNSSGNTYKWYNPSGQNVANGNTYTVPNVTSTVNYTVRTQIDNTDCIGPARSITVSPNDLSVTAVDGSNSCSNNDVVVQARSSGVAPGTSGFEHRLYQSADLSDTSYVLGQASGGGAAFTTSFTVAGQTRTYWLSAAKTVSGITCEGTRVPVQATYLNTSEPSLSIQNNNDNQCEPSATVLYAVGGSGSSSFQWYDENDNLLGSGSSLVVDIDYADTSNGSKTFYLGGTLVNAAGCSFPISPRRSKVVTVKRTPGLPSVSDDAACGNSDVTFTVTQLSGHTYNWYASDDTFITTGAIFTTPTLANSTDYKVSAVLNGCEGPKLTVTAEIPIVPEKATGENFISRCGPGSITLSAQTVSGTDEIRWYDEATGGTLLHVGETYDTPNLSESTYFFAESYNPTSGCPAASRTGILAKIATDVTYYADFDNDNLGDPNDSLTLCAEDPPAGYVQNGDDLCPEIQSFSNDCPVTGDPSDWSYVYTRTYQQPRNTVPAQKFDEGGNGVFDVENDYVQDITYFDGLGRPMQQIGIRQSPNNEKDIVTHIGYDAYGRQEKEWLPLYESVETLGSYRTADMEGATKQYYNTHPIYDDDFTGLLEADVNAYSEKEFETSPLNRILKQAAPGEDWKLIKNADDHSIEFAYTANTHDPLNTSDPTNDNVRLFVVDLTGGDGNPALADNGFYTAGELSKNVTRDENHDTADGKLHTTEEFTDKQGRVVLKRTYADADIDLNGNGNNTDPNEILQAPHDTYYVYDDYGNLTYVLPPKMEASTATLAEINTDLAELGYQYIYDHRNRLVEKQIPGKGEEYIIYNTLDLPIMTQDANQRANNEWLFTKYDAFGRVAYTGIYSHTSTISRADMQSDVDDHYVDGNGDRNSTAVYEERDNANAANYNYSNVTFPTANLDILTVNYFDDYNFDRAGTGETATALGVASAPDVKSLATGSKVKVLGTSDWITTVNYYDAKGRQIYSYSNNAHLGTVDIVENLLDFTGKPLRTKTSHTRNSVTIVTIDNFSYDPTGRLLAQTQCIGDGTLGDSCTTGAAAVNLPLSGPISDSQVATTSITVTDATLLPGTRLYIDPNATGTSGSEELIVYNDYDELGLLARKKVGGTPGSTYGTSQELQEVDYDYNVRGWLTGINDSNTADNDLTLSGNDLFGFKINYNDPKNFGSGHNPDALFNGNIAQTLWKTGSVNPNPPNNPVSERYSYTYDALNRIGSAVDNTGNYDLSGVTYDKNGNILSLNRQGHTNAGVNSFGNMDRLTYLYTGNQLDLVEDDDSQGNNDYGFVDGSNAGDDFAYDANGNMVKDLNKGIGTASSDGITYNHLNLPTEVKFDDNNLKKITYIYDAVGTKLKKTVNDNGSLTTTEYAFNHVYENTGGGAVLQFFNHPEGYVEPNGSGGYDYVYQYKDHLGNIRLSFKDISITSTPNLEIQEENNYYPFGLKHKGYNTVQNGRDHKFGFGGKEVQDDDIAGNSLDWLDFGARNYNPELGRWMNIDPLADLRYELTPYNYVQNSPMFRIDPDGLTDYTLNKKTGEVTQVGETNDEPDRILKTYNSGKRKGQVKYNRKGEAKVAIDGIEQGILSDGQNFKTDDNVIEIGGDGQPSEDGVKSFTLRLSEYIGKEIKGFSYSSDGSGHVTDMVLGKYINNLRDKSYGTTRELQYKYRGKFSFNNVLQQFHTHPDGKLGATQSAPGQSQDVTNLQNDKPKISNATFIILYRINGQKKPAEYDYTHEYRPKRK